jgi:hypothetical protein
MSGPSESDVSIDANTVRRDEGQGNHLQPTSDEPSDTSVRNEFPSHIDPFESGLGILDRGMREMVKVINRLHQVGAEDFVLPLPKITGWDINWLYFGVFVWLISSS